VKAKERRGKADDSGGFDTMLFERLRLIRKRLASESRVPPYVVFSDKTLHEMCRHFPTTSSEMRRIPGVGDVKLERYGEEFLSEIRTYRGKDT
jgi:ATP-dependent DNA helicase RecQ